MGERWDARVRLLAMREDIIRRLGWLHGDEKIYHFEPYVTDSLRLLKDLEIACEALKAEALGWGEREAGGDG